MTTLSRVVRGWANIDEPDMQKLARVLNCKVKDLF
jgi:hypothetical protein